MNAELERLYRYMLKYNARVVGVHKVEDAIGEVYYMVKMAIPSQEWSTVSINELMTSALLGPCRR